MAAQFYRPQQEDRGRSRLFYATAIVIIVFLLDLVAGGRLRAAARIPASYLYLSFSHAGETLLQTGIFSARHALELENALLRSELATYKEKDATYTALRDENLRLRTLTGLAAHTPGRAASIVSSFSASAYGTFTIDAGMEDGIARGATVYTGDGFAIGVVAEAGPQTSLVNQLFAPNATLESVVHDTRVVLEGHGGGNARAHAPRESTISIGDVVSAPSVNAPVGVVEHVIAESTGANQEIYVRIPANLETLSLVYVGRK
jgi:cell shape-determining protein MreC